MGIKHLREENGSGLVLTLMVLLVLSVLGISIGTLTIGSYRLGAANRDATSAYYVAEAGAVTAYDEIQRSVLSAYETNATEGSFYNHVSSIVTSQNGQSSVDFGEQFGTKPTATIATAQNDTKKYTITSTGEVDGKKRTVTKPFSVNWIEKNTGGGGLPTLADNAALLTQGSVEISNGTFQGDIYTSATSPNSITISGDPTITETALYYSSKANVDKLINGSKKELLSERIAYEDDIDFLAYTKILDGINAPAITEKLPDKTIGENLWDKHKVQDNGSIYITNYIASGYEINLDSDVYIPEINITWTSEDSSIEINTNGKDRTILVDTLDIAGSIKVTGGGKLTIYITDKFKINNNNLYLNEDGDLSQLTFVYLGEGAFHLDNTNKINGHMIVKNANVKVDSIPINGIFLTGGRNVALDGGNSGSNMMLIAPNAAVSLKGSYSINGTVIANSFDISGGASLKYAAIDTTGFPFGPSAPAVDPKPEDIINSEPIIEK